MILNNYRTPLKCAAYSTTYSAKNMSGSNVSRNTGDVLMSCVIGYVYHPSRVEGYNWCGICLGDGTTAPTLSDYCLDNDITSSLSFISGTTPGSNPGGNSRTADSGFASVTATYKNNTGSDITVKEIGLMAAVGQAGANYHILLTRDVLNTPVTIPAGQERAFTVHVGISSFTG